MHREICVQFREKVRELFFQIFGVKPGMAKKILTIIANENSVVGYCGYR